MQPESRKHLEDVRIAAEQIISFVDGRTFEQYCCDNLLRAGVERQFEIIGEALNRLKKSDPQTLSRIEDHRRIISFRNLLIHGYDVVDHEIVWDAISGKLPSLHGTVLKLLQEASGAG